jgi:purine-nucleoside phosphorylase
MENLMIKIDETVNAIKKICDKTPEIGIILGTGLGGLAEEIKPIAVIPYEELPHFPVSTVESHKGKLIIGELSGKIVIAMQGRFHYYEGYTMQEVVYPVRVMKVLGIKTIIVSNACGSVNPYIPKKSLMIIDDHINLFADNPLIGKNYDELGPRFPDMSEPYSKRLISLAESIALENHIKLFKGVYAAMSGPSLETRAEYRMIRTIGADVIGMSTIPEIIAAKHCGLETFGISIITDECYPDSLKEVSLDEIIGAANSVEPKMTLLIKELIKKI